MCVFHFIFRPSISKALLGSAVVHVGMIAATCLLWQPAIEHFALRGKRNAIFVEASFSENEASKPKEVRFEPVDLEPVLDPSQLQHAPTPQPKIVPRELAAVKSATRPIDQRVERATTSVEMDRRAAEPTNLARRTTNSVDRPTVSVKAPPPPPKTTVDSPSPRSQAAVEQIAGVDDDRPPNFAGNQPPSYPAAAIRSGWEGTVVLRLHIQASGRIDRVEVSKSSGYSILDDVAVAAVSKWRGQPALQSGRPVATIELLPIRFRLGDQPRNQRR